MPETGELIAGIIGAFASTLFSYAVDWYKDYRNKNRIRKIILADLEMQEDVLCEFGRELKNLINHIEGNDYGLETYDPYIIAPSDNVYKSNTMIDYHLTFGDELFVRFQALYEKLMLLKLGQASKIWNDFYDAITLIIKSDKYTPQDMKTYMNDTRRLYIRIIERTIYNKDEILEEILLIKNDIKKIGLEPFY